MNRPPQASLRPSGMVSTAKSVLYSKPRLTGRVRLLTTFACTFPVRYDVGELKDDEEDLEEFELLESLIPLGGLPGDPDCGLARHGPPIKNIAEAMSDKDEEDSKAAADESMDATTVAGESGPESDEDEEDSDGGDSEEEDDDEEEDGDEGEEGGVGESEYEKLRRERMAQNQVNGLQPMVFLVSSREHE